jgi:uncharacterized protein YeaO (DUF488 family)
MAIATKRAYDPPAPEDGRRVLVDRLWPRGLAKAGADIDQWAKDIAPSDGLRRWFGHDPAKWAEFRRRYAAELKRHPELLAKLARGARRGRVTLLYAAKDPDYNNAAALAEYLRVAARAKTPDRPARPRKHPARRRTADTAE